MPKWYLKYYKELQKCKEKSRANSIWLWHEETLAKMKAKLIDLKIKREVIQSTNIK